jgi:hypothetical protein
MSGWTAVSQCCFEAKNFWHYCCCLQSLGSCFLACFWETHFWKTLYLVLLFQQAVLSERRGCTHLQALDGAFLKKNIELKFSPQVEWQIAPAGSFMK